MTLILLFLLAIVLGFMAGVVVMGNSYEKYLSARGFDADHEYRVACEALDRTFRPTSKN